MATSYAVKALLTGAEVLDDERYGHTALTAAEFLFEDLDRTEIEDGARIEYKVSDTDDSHTLNANALGARTIGTAERSSGARPGRSSITWRPGEPTSGGWMYRGSPSASPLSMDNFHNGFIIESFHRYREVTDGNRYDDVVADARRFYREPLFEPSGAPNWDGTDSHPRAVHASAQGVVLFTALGDLEFAERILDWTLRALYAGDGPILLPAASSLH